MARRTGFEFSIFNPNQQIAGGNAPPAWPGGSTTFPGGIVRPTNQVGTLYDPATGVRRDNYSGPNPGDNTAGTRPGMPQSDPGHGMRWTWHPELGQWIAESKAGGSQSIPGGSSDDPAIQNIFDILQSSQEYNSQQQQDAIALLIGGSSSTGQQPGYIADVNKFYDPLIAQTESAIPLNPFSDAMRQKLLLGFNDMITSGGKQATSQAEANLASRGLSAGGTTAQTAAGGIISDLLNARGRADIDTQTQQLDFNTRANAQRQSLITDIGSRKQALLDDLYSKAAGIESGNVIDPMGAASIYGQELGLKLSEQNKQEMLDLIASMEPSTQQQLLNTLPGLITMFLPGANNVQAGAGMLFGPGGVLQDIFG